MRVFLVLLLSALLGVTEAKWNRNLNSDGVSTIVAREGGDSTSSALEKEDNDLQCLECNSDSYNAGGQGQTDCEEWGVTLDFMNYGVFNFFCGCSRRITGLSQCRRKAEQAMALTEAFSVSDCGVQIRCQIVDFDDQADGHKCSESCFLFGLFGCDAECDTTCFYELECEALAPAGGGGGGGGGKDGKSRN
jgi:hypothetical protein